jgi:Carbonic anhydrase
MTRDEIIFMEADSVLKSRFWNVYRITYSELACYQRDFPKSSHYALYIAEAASHNPRYVDGNMRRHDFIAERPALALGQNPFAGVLSCADSRIGPEYAFDTGRGDVFVCRLAGNFANTDSIASFEYAVSALGTAHSVVYECPHARSYSRSQSTRKPTGERH